MKCEEFESTLQRQADGCYAPRDEASLRQHARDCPACRELEEGFRFIAQGFAASSVPAPPFDMTDRIVAAAVRDRLTGPRSRRAIAWLAVAASLLAAIALWGWQTNTYQPEPVRLVNHSPLTTHHSPDHDEPLFPELADASAGDPRDSVVLVEAVEPVSEIFRAVGRSLGNPVRPIATNATEALGNLIREVPEPDSPMMSMPGMREFMPQPMKKEMQRTQPSS
jgi:hypothetical protein